jgi:hypothetical protein
LGPYVVFEPVLEKRQQDERGILPARPDPVPDLSARDLPRDEPFLLHLP